MTRTTFTQRRIWASSDDLFRERLRKINAKRPIDNQLSAVEFFDLLVKGKAPKRV